MTVALSRVRPSTGNCLQLVAQPCYPCGQQWLHSPCTHTHTHRRQAAFPPHPTLFCAGMTGDKGGMSQSSTAPSGIQSAVLACPPPHITEEGAPYQPACHNPVCLRHAVKSQWGKGGGCHCNRSEIPSLGQGNRPQQSRRHSGRQGTNFQRSWLVPLSPSQSLEANGHQVNLTQAPPLGVS